MIETKPGAPGPRIKPGWEWGTVAARARAATPEAFGADGGLLNLIGGVWGTPGTARALHAAVDGSCLGSLPMIGGPQAAAAVVLAAGEAKAWGTTPIDERCRRVGETCAAMKQHRDTLAMLLMWEIGKTWAAATNDVDRCIAGVEWYVGKAPAMLAGRAPLGLVSNIASWNYPLSVLVHALLVQVLCGNSVIAKTPTDGGGYAIGLSLALARRCGLPVSLVSGPGGPLSEALVRHAAVDCMSFVGGRATGRDIALNLVDTSKRYMLEMEGVNALGVWEFSNWTLLSTVLAKGYEYGKQRCTAYPRFVVQRRLLPRFLDTYLGVVKALRVGHPLLVARDEDPLPALDFGPLINARKVEELRGLRAEALAGGALPLFDGTLSPPLFVAGQDTAAYFAPHALLTLPRSSRLYYSEPFGPLDTIVVVDRVEELVAEMNVSNGNLCSSAFTDDEKLARQLRGELRGLKFGHNTLRSRGDRDEPFGGLGESWKGCFVGGKHLVQAVTRGPGDERLAGNFEDEFRAPDDLI